MNQDSSLPRERIWLAAVSDMLPLSLAVVPWGILCGSLAIQAGMTPFQAQAMSLFVFAGAAQLSGTSMIGSSAPVSTLFGSTFVISARHLLYSVNMRQHIRALPLRWRLPLGFLLTDEMYVVSAAHTERTGTFCPYFALYTGGFFYLCWNLATLVGVIGGSQFDNIEEFGLEFAIAATFIALVIPTIKDIPVAVSVLVSALMMVIFTLVGIENALLIAAILGMVAGFTTESLMPKKINTESIEQAEQTANRSRETEGE
ncbi:AzlC family ABC transporter permease [Enterovibrio norvegicus]|uniref:AzlC family ABC transporter permease n=1 Tax=Enterovibrio norvegicus TaxID=188144 RepID=UPI000303D8E4|nr:AzlC family ABC transporter permease [Enterovibrio norvegicus]MCC4796440.1 AzlC family ABC transporter permease [Enterovibrio norvegicus]OEE60802.1 branched-chain amino acid ABC transporter permease [Enterovibrio norvegicus]PMI32291.1 branched-chain amino acid ABC transporter permease [Enterovibrio norvegicus]TKF13615.1 AzlC family ABC transporter permease [Enterovibrio norvegicus]TKF33166.1 AzlC family ABC transporter permease [Enterovibrio norvegicus]